MKISYKVLKSYLPELASPEEIAQKLVMHTAEVEEVVYEAENLKDVYVWEVIECFPHPDSEKLNCTKVQIWNKVLPIVCWANNVKSGIKVPVAVVWCQLAPDFIISKTKIRWEVSEGMICSLDELWLSEIRQEWIWILPEDAPVWKSMREYLDKTDAVLEIDNKAINHRPDMFSHIWVIRELSSLYNFEMPLNYEEHNFSNLEIFPLENKIPEFVKRYSALKINNVSNIDSPEYIKQVLSASDCTSKGLLVDMTNYSLYFYGQPVHAFDADKIVWWIIVRFAINWEKFLALNDEEYELSESDIVIADSEKILALWWIIWWKSSAVSDETKSIVLESAHFDQWIIRKTGRILWIRTDALNVFEKNIPLDLSPRASALIVSILKKSFTNLELVSYSDDYKNKFKTKTVTLDYDFINNLIWKDYKMNEINKILESLWFSIESNHLEVPFFRTDISRKADVAEEVARIDWYDNIKSTVPKINLWAVNQSPIYRLKKDIISFFVSRWFYEMYNYSFVWKDVVCKMGYEISDLIPLKNFLSEEASHMRWDLVTNLMWSLESNIRDNKNLKLFEVEKVYNKKLNEIFENYSLAWVITEDKKDILYYELMAVLEDFFKFVWVQKYSFDSLINKKSFIHSWRTWEIIIRWETIWQIWEIHPLVAKRFDINSRVAFFEINLDKLVDACYSIIKAKEFSIYQENNFDLSFLVSKDIKSKDIESNILRVDSKIIDRLELIDIYENEEKMPWKRSLTFKVYINSLDWTIWDNVKTELIKNIVSKVSKIGWELRW